MNDSSKNNTAILIGNGFDLSYGMKTSYKNFVESHNFKAMPNNFIARHIKKTFEENDKKWVDIELELGNYSNILTNKKDPQWEYKSSFFEENFWELSKALKTYLSKTTESRVNSKLSELVGSWCNNSNVSVISFNYTYTASTEFWNNYKATVHYIHGKISSPNNVVLGIDETCEVPIEHSFLYKSFNPDADVNGILDIIDNANKIIIYGCSIGETDEFYFKHVFGNVKNKSFEIFYFGEKEKANILNRIHLLSGGMHKFRCNNEIKFIDCTEYSVSME